jgi:hypothetical protein
MVVYKKKKINIQKTVVFKLCYLSNIFLTRLIFLKLLPWCYLSKQNKKKSLDANDSSRQLFHPFLINVSISWVSNWVFSFSIYYRILILGVVLRAMTKSFFSFYLRFKYITRIWIDVFIKHYLQIRFLNLN